MYAARCLAVLAALVVPVGESVFAQCDYGWTWTNTRASSEYPRSIAVGPANEVVVAGEFDTGGSHRHFVNKLNPNGSVAWTAISEGPGFSEGRGVGVDSIGNVFVFGPFGQTVDFDLGPGVDNQTGSGLFVTKLRDDGSYLWTRTVVTPNVNYVGGGTVDAFGNALVVGVFSSTMDFDQGPGEDIHSLGDKNSFSSYVLKLDSAGSHVWAQTFDVGGIEHVSTDAQGNVFVTGPFEGTVDFDPTEGVDLHSTDGSGFSRFVTKLLANGSYGWTRVIHASGGGAGEYLDSDADGSVYLVRWFSQNDGPVDFDPSAGVDVFVADGADGFVTKYTGDGAYCWTHILGGPGDILPNGVSVGADRGPVVTGYFLDFVDFDPYGQHDFRNTGKHTNADIFLTELRSDGSYVRTVTMGGPGVDVGTACAIDNEGARVLTGWSDGGCGAFVTKFLGTPTDLEAPFLTHASAHCSETRPFSGHVDPRSESNTGKFPDIGLSELTFVFSEPIHKFGGGTPDITSFIVTSTGGQAPGVAQVHVLSDAVIRVVLDSPPPLQEWTTVRAIVEDLCRNPIVNDGDLGPGAQEPDRIDFLFLPGDVNQSGNINPLDLVRFKQIVNGLYVPPQGTIADYIDMNRDGSITPLDLVRFKQLINGIPPATQVWAGATANHPQP